MGTHYDGTDEEIRALSAFINLVRAAESLSARRSRHLSRAAGLTPSQFGALEALYHLGPMRQNQLGDKLLRSGGNVTMVVNHLEEQRLVTRESNPDDRRSFLVTLTAKGKRAIARVLPAHVEEIVSDMSRLSATELDTLRRLCRVVGKHTEEAR